MSARPWRKSKRWERRIDEPRLDLTAYAYITRDEKPLIPETPYQWWMDDAVSGHFEADGDAKTLAAAKRAIAVAWRNLVWRRSRAKGGAL